MRSISHGDALNGKDKLLLLYALLYKQDCRVNIVYRRFCYRHNVLFMNRMLFPRFSYQILQNHLLENSHIIYWYIWKTFISLLCRITLQSLFWANTSFKATFYKFCWIKISWQLQALKESHYTRCYFRLCMNVTETVWTYYLNFLEHNKKMCSFHQTSTTMRLSRFVVVNGKSSCFCSWREFIE